MSAASIRLLVFWKLMSAVGIFISSLAGVVAPVLLVRLMHHRPRSSLSPRGLPNTSGGVAGGVGPTSVDVCGATGGTDVTCLSIGVSPNGSSGVTGVGVVSSGVTSGSAASPPLGAPTSFGAAPKPLLSFHWRERWLNWINCLSAGLLIGVGLLHFLGECIQGAIEMQYHHQQHQAAQTKTAGSPSTPPIGLMDAHSFSTALHDGIAIATAYFALGLLIPLLVDRVLLSALKQQAQSLPSSLSSHFHMHSHSHGGPHGSHSDSSPTYDDHFTANDSTENRDTAHLPTSMSASSTERLPTATTTASGSGVTRRKQNTSNGALGHGTNSPPTVVAPPPLGTDPIPAASTSQSRQLYIKTVVLAVLLSLHSFTEGATLGLEESVAALGAAMIPMFLHKFFDGLVLGVSVGKRFEAQQKEEEGDDSEVLHPSTALGQESGNGVATLPPLIGANPMRHSNGGPASASSFECGPGVSAVRAAFRAVPLVAVAWTAVTPLVMIATAIGSSWSGGDNVASGDHSETPSAFGVAIRGIGAGSFIFIALAELIPEEFTSNLPAPIQLGRPGTGKSSHASKAIIGERLRQFAFLVAGIAVVVLLELASDE